MYEFIYYIITAINSLWNDNKNIKNNTEEDLDNVVWHEWECDLWNYHEKSLNCE